jgi:hypothetical protein
VSVLLCHHCREPIHESAGVCPHCGQEQFEAAGPPPEPNIELVSVFRTGDAGLVALAKSLLDAEGIEYMARGDGLQDLFGWGRLGGGFNYVVGPVEFVVRRDDAQRAGVLLRDLTVPSSTESAEDDTQE